MSSLKKGRQRDLLEEYVAHPAERRKRDRHQLHPELPRRVAVLLELILLESRGDVRRVECRVFRQVRLTERLMWTFPTRYRSALGSIFFVSQPVSPPGRQKPSLESL